MTEHTLSNNASILRKTSVVGSISLPDSFSDIRELDDPALADLVELRLDLYPSDTITPSVEFFMPLLITARCPEEGGGNNLSAKAREEMIRPWIGSAAFVDVEIRSIKEMSDIVGKIHSSSTFLLASYHDFEGTPPLDILMERMQTALRMGADAVKFATTIRDANDLATLTQLFAIPGRPPLSVMGMGPFGKVSRLLFAKLGSILNYGYLDAATVPGQWEAKRLKDLLLEL